MVATGDRRAVRIGAGHILPRQDGFSLMEVLVALLILAIGLLGLASLQTLSLKFNHQSYERTQATLLAYDILDRMRANPNGSYLQAIPGSDPGCTGTTANCDADTMARHDLYHWSRAIQRGLAGGAPTISISGNDVTTTLEWYENDVRRSMTMTTRPAN